MKIDDTIGCLLETVEGFPKAEAKLVKDVLVSAGKHGLDNLPPVDKAKMALAMSRYGLTMEEGVALYGKYVGNWGGEATRWRFDGKKNGKVIASQTRCPGRELHLEVKVSHRASGRATATIWPRSASGSWTRTGTWRPMPSCP